MFFPHVFYALLALVFKVGNCRPAADKNHIAINGDYFIIAAAAYFFVETYIPGKDFDSTVPKEVSIHSPITEEAHNFILEIRRETWTWKSINYKP